MEPVYHFWCGWCQGEGEGFDLTASPLYGIYEMKRIDADFEFIRFISCALLIFLKILRLLEDFFVDLISVDGWVIVLRE